jgi:hypothetical protein
MHVTEIYLPVINKVWFHQLFSFYQLSKASHKLLKLLLTTRKKTLTIPMTRFYFNFLFTQLSHFHAIVLKLTDLSGEKFSLLTMLEPWNLLPPTYPQAVKNLPSSPYPNICPLSALDSRWIDYLFYYERTYLDSARKKFHFFQHSCPHDWFISTHLRSRTSSKVKFKLATTTTKYLLII